MKELLALQQLDMRIAELKAQEIELPKQKDKYDIHRERLVAELKDSEERCKRLLLGQRDCEREIEQRQAQITKYEGQLFAVKKNEEYKALLYEIDLLKKQIAVKEERILAMMVDHDEAKQALEADKERIQGEQNTIDAECAKIDAALAEIQQERKGLQASRPPMVEAVSPDLISRYNRVRRARMPAVVPLNEEVCGGCFMTVRPQTVNEIMANHTIHSCQQCGRLLYYPGNLAGDEGASPAESDQ